MSLTVEPGELRAIIGPNGAGKTTFFNLISGFFPPTSGAILFDGARRHRAAAGARVRRGMARTFQITEIFPELTVADNLRVAVEVAAGLRAAAVARPRRAARSDARIDELLDMGGLADKRAIGGRRAAPRRPARRPRS